MLSLHPLRALVALSFVGVGLLTLGTSSADESTASPTASMTEPAFGQYLGACNATSDCPAGDTCFAFKKRGPHCTHACDSSDQCAAPSHGCTKLNVCGLVDPQKTNHEEP